MNFEAGSLKKHPTREEHEQAERSDLEQRFVEIEDKLATHASGRSLHKVLLTYAYDKLAHLEEKGLLTSEQAAAFHARAEHINGQLYEEAA
jgi:hypothetical protein